MDQGFGGGAARFDALLVADGPAAEMRAVLAAVGGRVEAAGWAGLDRALDARAFDLVAVEAERAGAGLEHALLRLARAAADGAAVMVSAPFEQVDLVAAALMGPRVRLLCGPTLAERIEAVLALAAPSGRVGGVREDDRRDLDPETLEEVQRIAGALAQLIRRERDRGPPADAADRRATYGAEPSGQAPVDPELLRGAIRSRRLRDAFLGAGLFADPAWDMLLDLFAAELEGAAVSVSSLCIAAAVPPTTALRWIGTLADAGLVERRPDPADRRRAFMALTDRGRAGMRGYLAAVERQGLGIA